MLDQWLERNQAYDVALRNLYKEISKVGKKLSPATKAAVKAGPPLAPACHPTPAA